MVRWLTMSSMSLETDCESSALRPRMPNFVSISLHNEDNGGEDHRPKRHMMVVDQHAIACVRTRRKPVSIQVIGMQSPQNCQIAHTHAIDEQEPVPVARDQPLAKQVTRVAPVPSSPYDCS
jgi:hypothetical protein